MCGSPRVETLFGGRVLRQSSAYVQCSQATSSNPLLDVQSPSMGYSDLYRSFVILKLLSFSKGAVSIAESGDLDLQQGGKRMRI